MKKLLTVIIIVLTVGVLVGCSSQSTTAEVVENDGNEPIKIGVIAPLAGGAAIYGEDAVYAYTYAVDKINQTGGIKGRPIELIYEDGKCGGKDATSAIQKLINVDGVELILGGVCSSETIAAGKIAQQHGVVMLSAVSSSPEVSNIGDYVFRYWNDVDAGKVMADYLEDIGVQKVAIINENDDYAVGYSNVVKQEFDGEVVLHEKIQGDEKDLSIIAKKLAAVKDEVDYYIFITVNEPIINGLYSALENEGILADITDKIIGGEVILTDAIRENFGSKLDGVKTVTLADLDTYGEETLTIAADIMDGYEVKSNRSFMLLWVDATNLMAEAIATVGTDPDAVRDYFAGLTADNPRDGFIGDFYFDAEGDGQGLKFMVMESQNGELVEAK